MLTNMIARTRFLYLCKILDSPQVNPQYLLLHLLRGIE